MGSDHGSLSPLRPYQSDAIGMVRDRGSLLLALTMGAGKTRVAVEVLGPLSALGPVLILCTNSLKYQWESEIKKWFPDLDVPVTVIDGTKVKRAKQWVLEDGLGVFIASYDMLIHDWSHVAAMGWEVIVADEATMVKSFAAKRSKRLKTLARANPNSTRLALTGQPVENRPEELFSIMEFVDATVLGSFQKFDRTFIVRDHWGKPSRYRNLDVMHKALAPAMFRKSREDIAEFLPKVNVIELPTKLDPKSQSLYDYIRDDLLLVLEDVEGSSFDLDSHYGRSDPSSSSGNRIKGEVMSRITAMRLLTNHPSLLQRSALDFLDEETSTGSKYASLLEEGGFLHSLPSTSSKLEAFSSYVDQIREEEPEFKLVVFCGFKPMLRILCSVLKEKGVSFTSMTGDTPATVRSERMTKFNVHPKLRVFVSSDAGAYGINLDSGTHLLNYDLPWSAGQLAQRVARIDRTSSKQSYIDTVYMFAGGTVEEYQYLMLREKEKISKAFVDGEGFDASGSLQLDLGSLRQFLLAHM